MPRICIGTGSNANRNTLIIEHLTAELFLHNTVEYFLPKITTAADCLCCCRPIYKKHPSRFPVLTQDQALLGRMRARRLRNQPAVTRIQLTRPSRMNRIVREIGAPVPGDITSG